jgi:hypothetical protein
MWVYTSVLVWYQLVLIPAGTGIKLVTRLRSYQNWSGICGVFGGSLEHIIERNWAHNRNQLGEYAELATHADSAYLRALNTREQARQGLFRIGSAQDAHHHPCTC